MASFLEKENLCQYAFDSALHKYGELWHVCTPGEYSTSFNKREEDYKYSVTNMAMSAAECGLVVITDQIMGNHIHSIVAGRRDNCIEFVNVFAARERKYLRKNGTVEDLSGLKCNDPIHINTLAMVRNEIAYVNRNGYVVNPNHTPFSYPWGGGSLYFNQYAQKQAGIAANALPYREKRKISFQSSYKFPDDYMYGDGMILPCSYVNFKLGQSFFRDAQHYFSAVGKNYEAYSEVAKRLGESSIITDDELYAVVMMIAKRDFCGATPSILPLSDKRKVALILHKDYNASNNQIRRLLKMRIEEVDSLFPLSAKR